MLLDASAITNANLISAIVNCVCPACGGASGVRKNQFQCRGECGKDWRLVWDNARPIHRKARRAADTRQVSGDRNRAARQPLEDAVE
jgi:hypothetical protein